MEVALNPQVVSSVGVQRDARVARHRVGDVMAAGPEHVDAVVVKVDVEGGLRRVPWEQLEVDGVPAGVGRHVHAGGGVVAAANLGQHVHVDRGVGRRPLRAQRRHEHGFLGCGIVTLFDGCFALGQ